MIEALNERKVLENGWEIRKYYTENGPVKGLIKNNCIESLVYIEKEKRNRIAIKYLKFYNIPVELNPEGTNYLMLGGGILSYPRFYLSNYPDKYMDVIEKEKYCIDLAKEHFYLEENSHLHIYIEDALEYIKNCYKKYDYILVDLFDGNKPIEEIFSLDNFQIIKNLLSENGILSINYIVSKENKITAKETIKNIVALMPYHKIISHPENRQNEEEGNLYILLSNHEISIPEKYEYIDLT